MRDSCIALARATSGFGPRGGGPPQGRRWVGGGTSAAAAAFAADTVKEEVHGADARYAAHRLDAVQGAGPERPSSPRV